MKGKKRIIKLLAPLAVMSAVLVCFLSGVFTYPEKYAEDLFYRSSESPRSDIFVIGIDEYTLSELGPFDEWSRTGVAEIINKLTEDPENAPAVIVLDIGYYGTKGEAEDDALVAACREAGNVVSASSITFGKKINEGTDGGFSVETVPVLYEAPFAQLSGCVASGHANTELDSDGVFRHALSGVYVDGELRHSLTEEAYRLYTGAYPDTEFNTDGRFLVSFSGKPFDYYGTAANGASFSKVLYGTYPAAAFKGSVVFIGAYAPGMQDNYYTSADRGTQMYGVEIHANILAAMLDGSYKTELSLSEGVLVLLLLAAVALMLFAFGRTKLTIPAVLGFTVLYILAAYFAFYKLNVLLPLVYAALMLILPLIAYIVSEYFTVHREKKRIIESYGRYLSPELTKQIADTGESSLKLGGVKRDIAVLFVDIRSFTTLSEALAPEQVVEMLNKYLRLTTESIFHNKGTVDKFIGDATMAVFNAPLELDDYTYRAVLTGIEMTQRSGEVLDSLPKEIYGNVGFGVGINCGDAVVGNIGTDFRMEYTAIGDTVNTASRLEGLAKAGEVVVSRAVYERTKDRIDYEYLGERTLKGKADGVPVYKVLGKKQH